MLIGISGMPTSAGLASMGRVLSAITDKTNEVSERTPSESIQLAGSVNPHTRMHTYIHNYIRIHTCSLSLSLSLSLILSPTHSVWLGRVGRDLWSVEALVNFEKTPLVSRQHREG